MILAALVVCAPVGTADPGTTIAITAGTAETFRLQNCHDFG
jgi:hypothetical protein